MRLETLASMTDLTIPFEALRDQVNSGIDVIVQLERNIDGTRRVVEVAAVASRRRETFRLASITRFDFDPIGPDRVVSGRFKHYRMPPAMLKRLALAGEEVPEEFSVTGDEPEAPEREAS